MPTPSFSEIGDNPTPRQIADYLVKVQRDLNWLLQNLDDLNVKRVTADSIYTGTLDANVVTIKSDLNDGAYVVIDGNGMRINNGTYDTFDADITGYVTMTGATVQTAAGYPQVILNPNGTLVGGFTSPTYYLKVGAGPSPQSGVTIPYLEFGEDGNSVEMQLIAGQFNVLSSDSDFLFLNNGTITLSAPNIAISGTILVDSWASLITPASITLQDELDILNTKIDTHTHTVSLPTHNHGVPSGSALELVDGSSATFVSSDGGTFSTSTPV